MDNGRKREEPKMIQVSEAILPPDVNTFETLYIKQKISLLLSQKQDTKTVIKENRHYVI